MEIWGGENLEVSFKIWMCGGQLVCAPCSHVGHVYRTSSPYKTTTSSLAAATNGTASDSDIVYLLYNSIRLAEVWLDEYKALFYERVHYDARGDHTINVSDRVALRQKLQCKSFDWYLTNVYPDLEVPARSLHYGEVLRSLSFFVVLVEISINRSLFICAFRLGATRVRYVWSRTTARREATRLSPARVMASATIKFLCLALA